MKVGSKTLSYQNQFERRLFFKFMLYANSPGVFGLINEQDKKIYIASSNNVVSAIGNVVSGLANKTFKIKAMRKDILRLRIILIEQTKGHKIAKLKAVDHFKKEGFTFYNEESLPGYLVRKLDIRSQGKWIIQLVSKGKREYTVAEFMSEPEANDFMSKHTVYDMLEMVRK